MAKISDVLLGRKHFKAITVGIMLFFCVWGLYLRYESRMRTQFSGDEKYQMQAMNGSFMDMVRNLTSMDYFPFLSGDHVLIYPFYKMFGAENIWGLLIPHIFSALLGFYMLYLLCRRYFKTPVGYFIAFSMYALNQTIIFHAFEVRWYAVLPTLALLSLYFTEDIIYRFNEISRGRKIAIGFLLFYTLIFHAYAAIIAVFPSIYFLGTRCRDKDFFVLIRKLLPFYLIVFALAAPFWILSIWGNHAPYILLDTFQYIPDPRYDFIGFLKAIFGNLVGRKALYFVLIGFVAALILPQRNREKQAAFFLILVVLPIMLLLMQDLRKNYYFIQRQFIWAMAWFAFYAGWCWESCIEYFQKQSGEKQKKT